MSLTQDSETDKGGIGNDRSSRPDNTGSSPAQPMVQIKKRQKVRRSQAVFVSIYSSSKIVFRVIK